MDFSLRICYTVNDNHDQYGGTMIYDFDELSFQILGVLSIDHPEGFFKVKGRQYAAFAYRVSGTAEFNFGEKRIISKPGDIIFIPDNISYDVDHSGGSMIVIHFVGCNYHISDVFGD